MRYRKLDENGDYSFGQGLLNFYIDEPLAVGQAVDTGLSLFKNEWYLNTDDGTPYFQGILGKYTQEMADTVLKDRIMQIQGVTSIAAYTSTKDGITRGLSAEASINTVYGQTDVQILNYGVY